MALTDCWLAFLILLSTASFGHAASKFTVLHAFGKGTDGAEILDNVVLDKKGNVYGTTWLGGKGRYGTVFKLTPQDGGKWKEKILHNFENGDPDGQQPEGGVVLDQAGKLYGTTSRGGSHDFGTVFEVVSGPAGWTFDLLYTFCSQPDCSDSGVPNSSMVPDNAGNLYGTTVTSVFELSPSPTGWTESVLYTFCSKQNCADGSGPSSLILDGKGNLYGATISGGIYGNGNDGTVYKLRRLPDGTWKERVLHSFGGPGDGITPGLGALARDSAGNLYGVTETGRDSAGIVYRLSRQPDGHWNETILHGFTQGADGYGPGGGVVLDSTGNIFGTTGLGGGACDCGVIYKLSPNPDDTWTYTVLHRFTGDDGAFPGANMVFDSQGNLYGTTQFGGKNGGGVVFRFTP